MHKAHQNTHRRKAAWLKCEKNHTQVCVSHDLSQGCRNQKRQVSLEAGGANARVKVGLTEGRKSSFEQSGLRVPSTSKKDTV